MRSLIRRAVGMLEVNPKMPKNFTVIVGSTRILFEAHVFQDIGEKANLKISRFEIHDEQGHFDRSIEVWGPHEVKEI